ncbi:hypothetical protein M0813_21917 [Anaeramoeba flamelloides]|uniref:Uncharacterized protein n=1 Tax=Anaeramoeba flamelloides TaxID=1746091 RepID=A0ABQ8YFW8_9EUKA|nr:hypothetical protein M0813_21917 [Anaeramoeba flamelloides]
MQINETKGFQNRGLRKKEDETLLLISFYYDHHKTGKSSLGGLYMFVENVKSCWRMKDPLIFLIANFPYELKIYDVLKKTKLVEDLKLLERGIHMGTKFVKAKVYSVVGDLPAQLEARGRIMHQGLYSCATCNLSKNDPNYTNPNFRPPKRNKKDILKYKEHLSHLYSIVETTTDLDLMKDLEKETGALFQLSNIWIDELGMDPTSLTHFPICWFHLLLEGLCKNVWDEIIKILNPKQIEIANKRWKCLKLPPNSLRVQNPFLQVKRTAVEMESIIQFGYLIIWDFVEKKYFDFLQIMGKLIGNLFLPFRNKEINKKLKKIIKKTVPLYKKCIKKDCSGLPNLHYLTHHLYESVELNGGVFTCYYALEKYHKRFKTKYGNICLGLPLLVKHLSKKECLLKSVEYLNLQKKFKYYQQYGYKKKLSSKTTWKTADYTNLKFCPDQFSFEINKISNNYHIFSKNNCVELYNGKIVKIIKFLKTGQDQNFKYAAVKYFKKIKNNKYKIDNDISLLEIDSLKQLVHAFFPFLNGSTKQQNYYFINNNFIPWKPVFLDYKWFAVGRQHI